MAFALLTGFGIVALALIMWVYFDAVERGKAAIPWALSLVFLGWLFAAPLILYVIFRDTGQRPVIPPGGARRQAVYVVSFAGLATLLTGLAALVTVAIIRAASEEAISSDEYGDVMAGSIAAIIVGLVAWAPLWFQAEQRLGRVEDDPEFRATFYLHRAYIYTVIGAALVVAFVAGLWLLGGGLSQAFGTEEVDSEDWLSALGSLSVAGLAVGYHYLFALDSSRYHRAQARFESIAPATLPVGATPAATPEPAPLAGETRFCTRCGARVREGDAYCAACGAAVAGV